MVFFNAQLITTLRNSLVTEYKSQKRPGINDLNNPAVTELSYPFELRWAEGCEPEFESALQQTRIFLVGTNHCSHKSKITVRETIEQVLPDAIVVEDDGVSKGEVEPQEVAISDLSWSTRLYNWSQCNILQLMGRFSSGGTWGGDYETACEEATKRGINVVPGDRPSWITVRRECKDFSIPWAFLRLLLYSIPIVLCFFVWLMILILRMFGICGEEFFNGFGEHFLFGLLSERVLGLHESAVFSERDLYMTRMLQEVCHEGTQRKLTKWKENKMSTNDVAEFTPFVVVAVFGANHVAGIIKNWTKQIDVKPLLDEPHPRQLN